MDISIDFAKKTIESSKLLVYLIAFLMKQHALKRVYKSNVYCRQLFNSCLDRILKNKYISNEDKSEIFKRALNLYFLNT